MSSFTSDPLVAAVATLLLFTALDVLAGIAVAVKAHTFSLQKLPSFLESTALPYLSPVLIAAIAVPTDWNVARAGIVAAAGAAVLKLAADTVDKLRALAK